VHFLNWILEQQDEPGSLGSISRLIWQDINNGCGLRYTSPIEWQKHFSSNHRKTAAILNNMLNGAFILYVQVSNEGE
jgi:hypothetical protein